MKPTKRPGPPKGVTNNPNGRPPKEPTQPIYKRVPVVIYPNCIEAINNMMDDYKINPNKYKK
jgi:hypothetical protein